MADVSNKNDKLNQTVADARHARELRDKGYRERSLKMYPWVCGRCARTFTRENLRELTGREREEQLTTMGAALKGTADIDVGFFWGRPSVEITREVMGSKHDLVVMPAESEQELGLGHVEIRLMRHCPAPVWVVRPGTKRHGPRVLVAVDSFVYDDQRTEMNLKLLSIARAFEETADAEVHVLHVWRLLTQSGLTMPAGYSSAELDRFLVDTRDRHRDSLDTLLASSELTVPRERAHLLEGDTTESIVRCVEDGKIDVLIMGSLHSLEIPGYFIGSTAEKILRKVTCSVLSVKPDGFESPIQIESPGAEDKRI